jgi:hypothetical protein
VSEHAETLEDEVLGTFRVEPYPAEDGGTVYGLRCELDGQKVSLTFAATGGEPVRRAARAGVAADLGSGKVPGSVTPLAKAGIEAGRSTAA